MITELKIGKEIARNDNFTLNVVELPGNSFPCYGVISIRHGVVEMSSSVLYQSRNFMAMLDNWEKEEGGGSTGGSEERLLGSLPDLPENFQ